MLETQMDGQPQMSAVCRQCRLDNSFLDRLLFMSVPTAVQPHPQICKAGGTKFFLKFTL